MTTTNADREPAQPLGLALTDQLGPASWQPLNDALENMLRETVARGDTLAPGWRDELRAVVRGMLDAERERCARICEAEADRWAGAGSTSAERLCAALIRRA